MKSSRLLFLGFTITTMEVIREIESHSRKTGSKWNVIVVSKKDVPELEHVVHIKKDFTELEVLKERDVHLERCTGAIIFAERHLNESPNATDIRTILTVYNLKKLNPSLYTLAEIINKENTKIIENTNCDAVVLKDDIDAQLIINCIKFPKVSQLIYDLLTIEGKVIEETDLKRLGFAEKVTFKELKIYGLVHDITFISYITAENRQHLAPSNSDIIEKDYRLFYIR